MPDLDAIRMKLFALSDCLEGLPTDACLHEDTPQGLSFIVFELAKEIEAIQNKGETP
jgi:hypothetical protein